MLGLPGWMRWNRLIHVDFKHSDSVSAQTNEVHPVQTVDDINCVTSERIVNGQVAGHVPILDLDIPHFYVESSTEGHAHLAIDVLLSEEKYEKLLSVLYECGIIQHGVIKGQWVAHRHTAMRLPGIKK